MLKAYSLRHRREMRELGALVSLAFHEPERIAKDFADPPELVAATTRNETIESDKWW